MTIKNIEELRERIEKHKVSKSFTGFVCIGHGNVRPTLQSYYGIDKELINSTGGTRGSVTPYPNWSGSDTDKLYYVTEGFYNNNIKEETPTPTKMSTYETYQKQAKGYYELMGIKVGSRVKVTHAAESHANGWQSSWVPSMDKFIGNEYIVDHISDGQVQIGGYVFPFFAVIPVTKSIKLPKNIRISTDYSAKFNDKAEVVVGCQTIPFTKLTEIYNAAKSVNDQL